MSPETSSPIPPEPTGPSSKPPKKTPWLIIVLVILLAVALSVAGVFVYRWFTRVDDHSCPPGTSWGYGGDPTGMTPEEIEAESSCLEDGVAYKPIIYLYPTEPTEISVRMSHPENFTVSYPTYGDGWKVLAQPNGDLVNLVTGNALYALYYESRNTVAPTMTDYGFVIPGSQTASFLEEALAQLGLSPRESQEFIIYWLPILQSHPYNYILFQTPQEIDANQMLAISPAPDTVIRVMMSYKPLTEPTNVTPQVLPPTPKRMGFVAVEWGGTLITS